jgi:hypothetical protein
LSARDATVLRREDAFDNLDLGDRIQAHDGDLVLAAVMAHGPLLCVGVCFGSVNGNAGAAAGNTIHLHVAATARADACGKPQQVREIPAIHRKLPNFLGAKGLGLQRCRVFDERCLSGYEHRFLNRADFEREGLPYRLPCTKNHAFVGVGLEAGQGNHN